ncbi:MAG: hypothetical protein H7Y36_10320 [Armatimonadetes bacterium]|nr:hypothetical protein [Akkermansiaceae bacterium]
MKRLIILPALAAAAFLSWAFIPKTPLHRAAFEITARACTHGRFFISGHGTHTEPFILHALENDSRKVPSELPTVVSLTDDPEGFFQSSPPSPVDIAIILKNLIRLKQDAIAIGTPLAWQASDTISLTALDQQLDALPSVITSAPLSRNPIPSPIPPAFRRASISPAQVHGDISQLPIVNRVSIPDVILGNKTSLAGFTLIESEPSNPTPHLLARWDDRCVLSFHLLAALDHFQVPPSAIEVRLGEAIALGRNGPFFPIDQYGRLASPPSAIAEKINIPATSLIDAPDDFLSQTTFKPILLRNDLSASDAAASGFSKSLAGICATLADPSSSPRPRIFSRLPDYIEILILAAIVLIIAGLSHHRYLRKKITLVVMLGILLVIHFTLIPATDTWLPTLPLLATVATYGAIILIAIPKPAGTASPPISYPIPPDTAPTIPELVPPAKKNPARKTARKKALKKAKKSAKKPKKQAAKKSSPRVPKN